MNILEAVILGLVQGFAEFLPISSSGHLLVFRRIMGIQEADPTYDILLHIATLIAVCIVFRKDIIEIIKNPFQKITGLLIVATIPAVIAALTISDYVDKLFETGYIIAITFFITGLVLIYADKLGKEKHKKRELTYVDALIIGIIQAIAITPGISRSGSTIAGSLSRGINRKYAAKFSFLMSIPAILGGFVFQLIKIFLGKTEANIDVLPMTLGFITATLAGYISIKFMLELIRRCKLKYFSYYLFVLGVLIIIDGTITHKFFL